MKSEINILFIGDIIGESGRQKVKKILPDLKTKYKIDFVIANGEHLSERVGVDRDLLLEMKKAGVDFFTTGNHVWKEKSFLDDITKKGTPATRPANFTAKYPGHGFRILNAPFGRLLIINLLGKEGINEKVSNPFKKLDEILATQKDYDLSILDFHAEMTSEKVAMGHHADGRVSAIVGTHTHVPTADAKIMPSGSLYISDAGMTGPADSILGVRKDIILERFITGGGNKFEVAEGEAAFNSVLLTFSKDFQPVKIKRIDK